MKIKIIPFLLIFSNYIGYCQTIKTEAVSISFSARDFETPLPFDVPFKIKGVADKNVQKIFFQYKVKDPTAKHYFPSANEVGSDGYTKNIETWTRNSAADDKFTISVGPLSPNVTYEFKFTLLVAIDLKEDDNKQLRSDLLTMMSAALSKENIAYDDITSLSQDIEARIQIAVGKGKLTDINQAAFSIDPFVAPLDIISLKLIGYPENIADSKNNIKSKIKELTETYLYIEEFKEKIDKLLANKIELSPAIKPLLDKPLSPLSVGYESYKFSDFLLFYSQSLLSKVNIESILEGKAKISGANITKSDKYDLPSIELLLNFYKLISSNYFTDNKNNMIFSGREDELKKMGTLIEEIIVEINNIKDYYSKLENLKTIFPDLIKNKVVTQNYNVIEESGIDVTSEKNPYVGLDVGIVYAPGLSNVFTYQGANIYFVPVNKKAPISSIPKGHKFGKIFSLYVGVTQKVGGPTDADYRPLINDVGSLLVGFGFRFNRIARINFGGLIYQYKNINPVLDKYDLKLNPTISLSLDLDVVKALGDVGKLLFSK